MALAVTGVLHCSMLARSRGSALMGEPILIVARARAAEQRRAGNRHDYALRMGINTAKERSTTEAIAAIHCHACN